MATYVDGVEDGVDDVSAVAAVAAAASEDAGESVGVGSGGSIAAGDGFGGPDAAVVVADVVQRC